jgi:hypothetical protein
MVHFGLIFWTIPYTACLAQGRIGPERGRMGLNRVLCGAVVWG